MKPILVAVSLLYIRFPYLSCTAPELGDRLNPSCTVEQSGHLLLQITLPQDLTLFDANSALDDQNGQVSVPAAVRSDNASIGSVPALERGLIHKDVVQRNLQLDGHAGDIMKKSIGDVSSGINLPQFSDTLARNINQPHKMLLMRSEGMQATHALKLAGLLIIMFGLFLAVLIVIHLAGLEADGEEEEPGKDATDKYTQVTSGSLGSLSDRHGTERSLPEDKSKIVAVRKDLPPPMQGTPEISMRMHADAALRRTQASLQAQDTSRQPSTDLLLEPRSCSIMGPTRYLCPGLVVPKGSECTLFAPSIRFLKNVPLNMEPLFVRDVNGKPVIQVEVLTMPTHTANLGTRASSVVVLRSAIGVDPSTTSINNQLPLLARMKPDKRQSATIYDAHDEIFAYIFKNPLKYCYLLTSKHLGMQAEFRQMGTSWSVIDDTETILAEIQPITRPTFDRSWKNQYFKITVLSESDAGLILSGLYAVDHLEHVG